jgi:hypothetical protein
MYTNTREGVHTRGQGVEVMERVDQQCLTRGRFRTQARALHSSAGRLRVIVRSRIHG